MGFSSRTTDTSPPEVTDSEDGKDKTDKESMGSAVAWSDGLVRNNIMVEVVCSDGGASDNVGAEGSWGG